MNRGTRADRTFNGRYPHRDGYRFLNQQPDGSGRMASRRVKHKGGEFTAGIRQQRGWVKERAHTIRRQEARQITWEED